MAKDFKFRGHSLSELKDMSLKEFSELLTAKKRRSIRRGFTPNQEKLLEEVKKVKGGEGEEPVKTQARDMVVIPQLVGVKLKIYTGQSFKVVKIVPKMIGHYLGEFTLTRQRVDHSAPGVGATRSSKYIPLK